MKAFPNLGDGEIYDGMDLRDYFASAALTGELAAQIEEYGCWTVNAPSRSLLATRCYEVADAMIAERSKGRE